MGFKEKMMESMKGKMSAEEKSAMMDKVNSIRFMLLSSFLNNFHL